MGKTRIGDLVSDNLISTDIDNDRVGIGSTLPSSKLDVSGDANISGIITASSANFSGNVSIGGTLTYEDVTNVDSIGLITARSGINVTSGGINAVGVVTATSFDGSLATTDLTGTITNAQLAGSIENSKLSNSTVSYGGVSLSLGGSDATPAFDLSDAANYPYDSLTGITTNIVGDTTPQLGGNLDVNGNDITGTGNINLTGIVSATSYYGDGSTLSGLVTSITAGDNISIDSSTGSVTITGLANTANIVSDTIDTGSLNVTGVSTFNGPGTEVIRIATQTRSASSQEEFGIGFAANVDDTHPAALITYQEFDNDDFRGELAFYTRSSTGDTVPTEKMRITKDGDIGIGTNNPNRRLDVRGSGSVARFGTEDPIGDRIEINVSDPGYPKILNVSSSDTLSVVSRGSVQIAIDSNNSSTDKIFNVVSNGDSGSGTELFRIDEDGEIAASGNINVAGVVTTSKLHVDPVGSGITYNEDLVVQGNARVTGILSIGTSSIVLDANAKTIRGLNEIRLDSDDEDDEPVIFRQRRGKVFFRKTRRNHSNQIVEIEEEASVGIGTTVSVNTSGIITASSFYGDGSNLTGLTHSQVSGVMVNLVDDTTPQLGGNLDLNSNDITGTGNINITGSGTFSGNVSIAGTLTYEDVTNVDSIGLITARSGVDVTGNISVTGTVDGRDIASDGSKLDGIESGATADQTAAEILTLIKTVDGAGSGLDADTLDGISSASFLRSDANDSATGLYSFAAGGYSANVTYGGRSIQTQIDINSTSMRGGVLVRNANDYRSETASASFMHYDAYSTSATSYAFRAAKGTTLADTFWVKGDGSAYFDNDVEVRNGELLVQTGGNNTYGLIKGYDNNNHFIGIRAGVANQSGLSVTAVNKTSFVEYAQNNDSTGWYWLSSHINYGEIMRLTRTAGLQVLGNKVWHAGNDGSGSGLDADTLDGISSASFLRSDTSDTMSGGLTISNSEPQIVLNESDVSTAGRIVVSGSYLWFQAGGTGQGAATSSGNIRITGYNGADLNSLTVRSGGAYNTIWHAGNDGSGSGLDADTLDGLQASSFLRSDTASEITAPLIIDSDNNENGALRIENFVTDTNNDFYFAQEISQTLSGSQVATSDREQGGIYMDINSTNTGGDTSNEHRAYGIYIDLDSTGDADVVNGLYVNATATPTTGTTSSVYGGYFFAEDNGGAGAVSNVYGVQAFAHSDNSNSDTNNQYGGYFKSYCAADSAAVGTAYGVYSEIEINGTTDLYGPCYALRAEIDNNTNVEQTNTSYLLYGNYSGTLPTTAYGVYINNNVPSYFGGGIEIPNGPGTIAGGTFANGWLRIGTSSIGWAFDSNELITFGTCIFGSASGSTLSFTNRPAFNGGTSGSTSPFTVDSTQVVTNLNADLLDGFNAGSFVRSDQNDYKTGGFLRFNDNLNLQMGTDNDISFFYNGSDFYMDFQTAGDSWYIRDSGDNAVFGFSDSGNLSLYKGDLNVGDGGDNSRILIKKADNNVSDHIQFYNGTTRMGEIGCEDTTWLRINQETAKNIFTPRMIRADGGFTVGSGTVWHSGNDGSGSGLDADTLDGQNLDVNATANTVVSRNGSADINCRLLRPNYGNNSYINGALAFRTNNSNDNYVRFCNDTALIRTYLGVTATASDGNYLRSNANDTLSAIITGHASNTEVLRTRSSSYSTKYIYFGGWSSSNSNDISRIRSSGNLHIDSPANGNLYFNWYASNRTIYLGNTGQTVRAAGSNIVWHTGNDGAGSGLDADTVDGIQGSALAPIASPTFTGNVTIPSAIVHDGDTNNYIQFHAVDQFRVVCAGSEVQEWGNNYTKLGDNDSLRLGAGSDYRMWHDGTSTFFRNYNHSQGTVYHQGENTSGTNHSTIIEMYNTARTYVRLYENNGERLRTTSGGVQIYGALTATGDVTAFSDITLKEDVEVIPDALNKVSQIRGVTFTRKDLEDKSRKSGVIAQEVEKVLPEVVTTTEDGTKTVAYGNLVGLLIESIKELKAEVETLKAERN